MSFRLALSTAAPMAFHLVPTKPLIYGSCLGSDPLLYGACSQGYATTSTTLLGWYVVILRAREDSALWCLQLCPACCHSWDSMGSPAQCVIIVLGLLRLRRRCLWRVDGDRASRLSLIFKAGYIEGPKLYASLPLLRFCLGGSGVTSKSSTMSTQSYIHFKI